MITETDVQESMDYLFSSAVPAAQARRAALIKAIRDLVDDGNFQPSLKQIAHASGSYMSAAVDVFGSKRGLAVHAARHHAGDVVVFAWGPADQAPAARNFPDIIERAA